MRANGRELIIPSLLSISSLLENLKAEIHVSHNGVEELDIVCLDTFDWLLFANNISVEMVCGDKEPFFAWRSFNSSHYRFTSRPAKGAAFAWDFPEGKFRQSLNKIINVRALLPKLKLKVRRTRIAYLNNDRKTVARGIVSDYLLCSLADNSCQPLQQRVELIPLRGYDEEYQSIDYYFQKGLGLIPVSEDILEVAVAVIQVNPRFYVANPKIVLEPNMRSDEAVRLLLGGMLQVMSANTQGICNDIDSEFLHDFRVVMRKSRSLLKTLKAVVPAADSNYLLKNLSWLSKESSATRDMDVYLLKFDAYRYMLPEDIRDNLQPLHALLKSKKRKASKKLAKTLQSERFDAFVVKYRSILSTKSGDAKTSETAAIPIKQLADRRIWKLYQKILGEGFAITDNSPASALHELRKSCKKLRYLIDFFRSLYDEAKIKKILSGLKKIQENLGDFNDYHVQIEKLTEFESELNSQNQVDAPLHVALSYLLKTLDQLQIQERSKFNGHFQLFSAKAQQALYRNLFNAENNSDPLLMVLKE